MARLKYTTSSEEETMLLGHEIAKGLAANDVLLFYGDLGAGKTTLIKGIVEGLCGVDKDQVQSPTFVYMQLYQGPLTLCHYDLYRLSGDEEFYSLGLDEMLQVGGVSCVEWPEKVPSLEEESVKRVYCSHLSEGQRSYEVVYE